MLTKLIPNGLHPTFWRNMGQELKLVWRVWQDGRTPLYLKAFPFLIGLYLISPFDIIPGFLPIIGQLDDAGLLLLGLKGFLRLAPQDIVAEHSQALALAQQ
jgi:uncharacterized membrane protein YkvA (DUF1232 family)